jgi:hypothetical protein
MTKTYSQEQLLALRDRHEPWLMAQPGVIGTGIGLDSGGRVVLRIFTHGATPVTRRTIANRLGGVPLGWEEGDVVPQ